MHTDATEQKHVLHVEQKRECSQGIRRRLVSDVVEKNIISSSKSNPLRRRGKNYDASRREGVGVVVEKNEESRRTFKKACDLLTAITHIEILLPYTKQINNLTRKQNYESKTVDVSMM